ncbi:TIGR04086 family membrane protein [Limnochorda pilosa]|nr:TIGR04086 family membrane protein [Limnochorda pilosa]
MARGVAGGGGGAGFEPVAVLVGLALSLVLFVSAASVMGVVYGLWSAVSYPPWAYLAVHGLALLAGGGLAGGRGRSGGWLHGLAVGVLYVAAALWVLPHGPGIAAGDALRGLILAVPLAILGGALGRNAAGSGR